MNRLHLHQNPDVLWTSSDIPYPAAPQQLSISAITPKESSRRRVQRTIERLLGEAEDAISQSDWAVVRDRAQNVLALDHDNRDALAFVEAAHTISQFTPNLSFSH